MSFSKWAGTYVRCSFERIIWKSRTSGIIEASQRSTLRDPEATRHDERVKLMNFGVPTSYCERATEGTNCFVPEDRSPKVIHLGKRWWERQRKIGKSVETRTDRESSRTSRFDFWGSFIANSTWTSSSVDQFPESTNDYWLRVAPFTSFFQRVPSRAFLRVFANSRDAKAPGEDPSSKLGNSIVKHSSLTSV